MYCCIVLYLFPERKKNRLWLSIICEMQCTGNWNIWSMAVHRRAEAASKPRSEHIPKRVSSFRRSESPSSLQDMDGTDFGGSSGSYSFNHGPPPSYSQAGMHAACGVSLLALSLALWVSRFYFLFFLLNTLFSVGFFCLFLFSIHFCLFFRQPHPFFFL